jgi:hypothetical protein
MVYSIQNLTRTMVLREDQEKVTYTQKVDFAKLRSELLTADSTESSLSRASHERLTNELAKLNSKLRDEIQRTQASVRLDLNLEKGRIREEANVQELKIKETETRIEQETAVLRERLEAVKFSTLQWLMYVSPLISVPLTTEWLIFLQRCMYRNSGTVVRCLASPYVNGHFHSHNASLLLNTTEFQWYVPLDMTSRDQGIRGNLNLSSHTTSKLGSQRECTEKLLTAEVSIFQRFTKCRPC